MAFLRILRTAQVTLSHTFYVDETATDAAGTVTVTVKRLDGTAVSSANAVHPGPAGVYTYALPAQSTLDILTVDWAGTVGGASVTVRDYVEICGGYLFGLAEARAMPPILDAVRFTTARLAAARLTVEEEAETITGRAFVPRFKRIAVAGTDRNELVLPDTDIRTIRAVTIDGTAYSAPDIANITVNPSGVICNRYRTWWARTQVVIEYEYGLDYPPVDISQACMLRLRSILTQAESGIPQRAVSWTAAEGGVFRISLPSALRTGVPDVDAVYDRWQGYVGGMA